MSRLEDLIQTLCPDGVEYKPLGSVVKILTAPQKLNRSQYRDSGQYAIVDQGQTLVIGFTDYAQAVLPKNKYVVFGDHTRIVKYIDFPFAQGADGLKILLPKDNLLDSKYLYYAFTNLQVPSRGYNRHWSVAQELSIPLPPLPVQEEIVRILDTFSGVVTELEAEQAARVRQYEHYRNELLSFDSNSRIMENLVADFCADGVEYIKLGDIAPPIRGVRVIKSQLSLEGRYPVYQNSMTPLGYYEKQNCLSKTVFVISAGAAGEVGYSNVDFWAADDCFYFNCPQQLLSRFLYHLLKSQQGFLLSRVRRASVPRLARSVVEGIEIPIPPLPVQEKIVSILDRFDTLVNDLKSGLPAEITLRRKQYEYYRDKLLTFKPIQPPL